MGGLIHAASPPAIVDITPSLQNGWAVSDGYDFKVYREGQRVWIEAVLSAENATDSIPFTLPAGSRPGSKLGFGGAWFKEVFVNTDGTVFADHSAGNAVIYFTGITFRGE